MMNESHCQPGFIKIVEKKKSTLLFTRKCVFEELHRIFLAFTDRYLDT